MKTVFGHLNCPTESNLYMSMAAIKITGSVFGEMISVYSMHVKPSIDLILLASHLS